MKKFLIQGLICGCLGWLPAAAEGAPSPERFVLPNGIPLIVQESFSSPTVSLNIFIRVGSVYEPSPINGISHFYEHMFFRGTPTRTGLRFKREIEALGGITNATTGRDYTHFYINLPKQYLRKGLELLADAYLHAECSQESVDAERLVVLEEYNLGLNQPARLMSDKLYSLVFSSHPYGRSIIGTEENLKSIGRTELIQFKRDFYVPARTKLVITGELDPQQVLVDCQDLFGSYQAKGSIDDKMPVQTPPPETVVLNEVSKGSQPQIALAFLGPGVKDRKDVQRIDLLSFMIGNGKASLLGKELDAAKTGRQGRVEYLTQAYPGMIVVSADAEAGKEDETLKKVDAVLQKVREGNFSDKDIKRAQKTLTNLYRFGNETNAGKADNWGVYETIDKMDFSTTYMDDINKLSKADLVSAAQKYFGRNHYRLIFKAGRPGGGRG
ncbi:insulinase family protein [bacterium]|nr:insulinase family protein [bacterium]